MSNKSPFFNVVKNEAAREATIYIYGAIGGIDYDTWKEKNTAEKFKDEFKAIEADADTIHVRINSPGGYVFEGLAIYNILFASDKKIITYNDGLCASMAALILLSGDEIHAFSNSLFMLHNASGMFFGNKKEVEDQMELLANIDEALSTAIEERLGITSEEVAEKYLNYKDNWLTSKEAKETGFYDQIIKKKKAQLPTDAINMTPVQLMEKYAAMTFAIPNQKPQPENTMSKPQSYPNLEATLGLSAPLATNDNGSYLNEDQKSAIENALTASATALKTAQDAKAQAEADLQAEKDAHQATKDSGSDEVTGAVAQLRAAATLAGVEGLADDASAEDINTALTAKIQELNGKPGASHTSTASNEEDPGEYAYLELNSSIYQNQ